MDLRTINRTVTIKHILCLLTTLACSFSVLAQNPGETLQQRETSDFLPRTRTALASNDATGTQSQTSQKKPTRNLTRAAEAPKNGDRHVYKTVGGIDLPLYVFQPNQTQAQEKRPAIFFLWW